MAARLAGAGVSPWRSSMARVAAYISIAMMRVRLSTAVRSLRAADQPIETWSSCMAEEGIESAEAGTASRFISLTRAACVYWAIIRPESTPASSARNGGRPCERFLSSSRSVRRSAMEPRSAAAMARKSRTYATGAPWKLPLDSTRPSGSTTGLSTEEASSREATRAACAMVSRPAPATCGAQRTEYASCTRGADSSWKCPVSPESFRTAAMFAAEAPWPGCGRMACSSGASTFSVPRSASRVSAAVMSADLYSLSRSARAMTSMPSMPSVPLRRARPSFSFSTTGWIPASASSSPAGRTTPSGPSASPSPIRVSAQCESGARSPEQPSEPYSWTTGVMPALSTSAIVCATDGRTPVCPEATVFRRRNIRARTTSRSTRGPMPAACERTMLRCSWARSSGLMCREARAPKPVDTP